MLRAVGPGEARKAYEAVVSEYGDESEVAAQAKARLRVMGNTASAAPSGPAQPNTRLLWVNPDWWEAELSPDGRMVAFIDETTTNLWVRDVATGTDRKLTEVPKEKAWGDLPESARWSPDGTRLAFGWTTEDGPKGTAEIRTVDLRTGAIATFARTRELGTSSPLDWAPDGSRVLVALPGRVMGWLSLTDGSVSTLSKVSSPSGARARVSPDGSRIVFDFADRASRSDHDVFITTADGSSTNLLVGGPTDDRSVAWTPDGSGVLFEGERSGVYGLWLVRVDADKAISSPQLVTEIRATYSGSSRSGTLLYVKESRQADLWTATVDLSVGRVLHTEVVPPPAGAVPSEMGSFSRDGRWMLYAANIGRRRSLVVSSSDGSNPRLITPPFEPSFWGPPSWAADSSAVFLVGYSGVAMRGLYRMDVMSGAFAQMLAMLAPFPSAPPATEDRVVIVGTPADGKTVYAQRNHAGSRLVSIWKRDVATGAESELFRSTGPAGISPGGLSPDGTLLAFLLNPFDKGGQRQLMVLPLNGGAPRTVCAVDEFVRYMVFAPDGRSIIFGQGPNDSETTKAEVWQVSTAGGQPRKLGISHEWIDGLAVHPDGKHLAYVGRNRPNQGVWLLDHFLPPAAKAPTAAPKAHQRSSAHRPRRPARTAAPRRAPVLQKLHRRAGVVRICTDSQGSARRHPACTTMYHASDATRAASRSTGDLR